MIFSTAVYYTAVPHYSRSKDDFTLKFNLKEQINRDIFIDGFSKDKKTKSRIIPTNELVNKQ